MSLLTILFLQQKSLFRSWFGSSIRNIWHWNPSEEPLFVLSANSQQIPYATGVYNEFIEIEYSESSFDLSMSDQTCNFNLYVFSNFERPGGGNRPFFKNYNLNIYFSKYFTPVDNTLFNENNYPRVYINLDDFVSQSIYEAGKKKHTTIGYYIESDGVNENVGISYENRVVPATKRSYNITVPSGLHSLDLINFSFYWDGYTSQVYQYWDMEAYVRVEIVSES